MELVAIIGSCIAVAFAAAAFCWADRARAHAEVVSRDQFRNECRTSDDKTEMLERIERLESLQEGCGSPTCEACRKGSDANSDL